MSVRPSRALRRGAAVLLCAALSAAAPSPLPAADRALLVGIDTYRDPRVPATPGAVADARAIAAVLERGFGFPAEAVRLLVGEEATAARIVEEFESWLVAGSAPGDRVFFFYAGHGSQLADDDGDEDDGLDETLAPWDVEPMTGGSQVRDDLLDGLIARLSGRRAVLMFDSCHSGTVTRALPGQAPTGPSARYLPRPEELRRLWGGDEGEDGEELRTRTGGRGYVLESDPAADGRGVVDDPSRLGRLSGIVAISAAGPGELAWPVEVEGGYRGALSWVFERLHTDPAFSRGLLGQIADQSIATLGSGVTKVAVDAVTGAATSPAAVAQDVAEGLTVGALQTAIHEGVERLQGEGRLPGSQQPWFEVISEVPIADQPLFGAWEQASAVAMNNPLAARQVTLRTAGGRTTFARGERIEFEVWTDRPGHLYLLVFSEGRAATCIFPNRDDPDGRMPAGVRRLPSSDDYFFPAGAPFGQDLVVALVADAPMPLCERIDYTWDEIFQRVDLPAVEAALAARSQRGIRVESAAGDGAAAPSWQAARLVLETVPGPEGAGGGR